MSSVRDRLRTLLADPEKVIWSDSDLDSFLEAHQQRFSGVALERRSPTIYACPDGRWLWADGFTPVFQADGIITVPESFDRVNRQVVFDSEIPEEALITADFIGTNIYYAAADAKLAAAGSSERQRAVIAQGQIRLSDRSAAEQLRDDAEAIRRLGLPAILEFSPPKGR